MAEGNLGQFAITDQKLDKILQQCRELEGLMRSFVAKRLVAPAPAPRTDQNQSIAFLESKGSSEDNFKGGAHKMFDVMPSKDVVPLPSETPEIRSMVVNKEAEDLDLKLQSQDRRESMSVDLENLDLNLQSQGHQTPEVAVPVVIHREKVEVAQDFNKLLQVDDVESYTEAFEKLRVSMLVFNPSLPEAYFVTSYISGLKQEIKNLVKLGRPKSLADAYEEARMHYDAIQAIISDLEQEYSDRKNSMENIQDWDADTDRDADVGCQGLSVLGANFNQEAKRQHHSMDGVLEVHPKEFNREARDQSFVISTEFRGKTTSLNLEFHVFEDCSMVAKCQKRSRNYEITGAHILFDEMSKRRFSQNDYSVQLSNVQHQMGNWVFDPGSAKVLNNKYYQYFYGLQGQFKSCYTVIFDGKPLEETEVLKPEIKDIRGVQIQLNSFKEFTEVHFAEVHFAELMCDFGDSEASIDSFVFDPGGMFDHGQFQIDSSIAAMLLGTCYVWDELVWVFDPGGILHILQVSCEVVTVNAKSFVAVNSIATLGANTELMGMRILVFSLAFLVLSDGFSSISASIPPAKIVSGVLSNAITKLMKWAWSLKTTTKTANSSRQMMKFEIGHEIETVFDGSKLGIEPNSVEFLPSEELEIVTFLIFFPDFHYFPDFFLSMNLEDKIL